MDRTTWSALGSGVNGEVRAIAISGTNVYVGGAFTTAGGNTARRIARWNGTTWSALGNGFTDSVNALAISGTNVYASGWFESSGALDVNQIARWTAAVGWRWAPD